MSCSCEEFFSPQLKADLMRDHSSGNGWTNELHIFHINLGGEKFFFLQ